MNLLHVLHSLDQRYGGPIRAVLDLSSRSFAAGLDSEVLGFGRLSLPDNPFPEDRIHRLPVSFPERYCYSPQLRSWLRQNLKRFDGVVLHGMWLYPNWAVARECLAQNIPYACFPHGMLEPWAIYSQGWWKAAKKILYWALREREILLKSSCIFFTTKRERELAAQTFPLPGSQLILVPYGVDVNRKQVSQPTRKDLIQPAGRRIGLFLGRIHPKKNVDFLVNAWAGARPGKDWYLLIAGTGDADHVERIRRLIRRLGLAEQVQLLGFVSGDDKAYLLQRADWFLLPSQQENFGIAVVEAIGNGCPVAISDQVYLGESLHESSEVLPLRLESWTEFLRERMVDDEWRAKLQRLDETCMMETFEISKVSLAWARTLRSVFEGRVAAA